MTATATTPATRHAKRMLSRYRRLKQQGRCMCGRRARARRVKCRRCALADNRRSKLRYARMARMWRNMQARDRGATHPELAMSMFLKPHHD